MAELEQVSGSGKDGRVTKKDILAYVEQRVKGGGTAAVVSKARYTVQNS